MCYTTSTRLSERAAGDVDLEGFSRWIPMATAMERLLADIVARGEVSGTLPATLYHASVYFLSVAQQGSGPEAPADPEMSIANYCIAATVIRSTTPAEARSEEHTSELQSQSNLV